jgi:hypothetical protein
MVGRFLGRKIIEMPSCPFCGLLIERPKELATRMPTEMPVGACPCGAVYACDVTGHNLGSAMIEALVFGCNGNWDLAWDLLPEEDYLEEQIENYDHETHHIVPRGAYEGRRIAGILYFIRLHRDIREVTGEGVQQHLKRATPVSHGLSAKQRGRKPFTKKKVEDLVKEYDVESLLTLAQQDKRIIRDLQRLLYSVDSLLRCRAADVLASVSALIAQKNPGTISGLLQELFTPFADTAASNWGALDAIGEIISKNPERFAGYVPQLYQLIRWKPLLAEVLRALGKIGGVRPDLIRKVTSRFIPLLQDPDPEIRSYAAILLGNSGSHEAKAGLTKLQGDMTEIKIYRDGDLEKRTIGQLASEALEKL